MGFALARYGLAPTAFWTMSMPELEAMIIGGAKRDESHTSRSALDRLMKNFPDQKTTLDQQELHP